MSQTPKPWGTYAPPAMTMPHRTLTKIGLGRGGLGKRLRKHWVKHHPGVVDAAVRGIKYRLHIETNTTDAKLLTSSKCYDKPEIDALASAARGSDSVFLDVGANSGYYSLTLAKKGFSKVLAIEPNPATLEMLRFNVAVNELESVIEVLPFCVGEGGVVPFYLQGCLGNASLIATNPDAQKIEVESKPLLELVQSAGVSKIDGMKIDVEGYEDQALLPFYEQAPESLWPRMVVIEDCHSDDWATPMVPHLRSLGYRTLKKTRGNSVLEKR